MDDNIYLTSNLFLKENHLFYETNKGIVKLNRTNWHKYLKEYDYNKLSLGWKKKLKSELSPKNSLWGIRDCGGEGDCLFLCIEEALRNFYEPDDDTYSVLNLRTLAAECINEDNFEIILETYKAEEESGEFDGFWEPNEITDIEELKDAMKECGNSFWGDHIFIQLLSEALKLNFIILNEENEYDTVEYNIQRTFTTLDTKRRTIILSYYSNIHYQLIGYFNGQRMQTVFNYEELPEEILKVYGQ